MPFIREVRSVSWQRPRDWQPIGAIRKSRLLFEAGATFILERTGIVERGGPPVCLAGLLAF